MLLDEDPATLIHHTVGNFNIQPDKLAVSRINESLSTLQQARDLRAREAESALRKLSRTLATLNNHYNDMISSHSPSAHASEIATLDTQKFRVAKAANDLEVESERLSSQLADLQARLQELDVQGLYGSENTRRSLLDDETCLKLKIFRSLGIEAKKDNSDEYSKAVVNNGRKGDVHIVNLDNKFSRFFYADFLWDTL